MIVGHTEAGQEYIASTRIFILDVLDKVPIAVVITVKKKHHSQVLILGNILGLFTFCVSRQVRICCNACKDCVNSI